MKNEKQLTWKDMEIGACGRDERGRHLWKVDNELVAFADGTYSRVTYERYAVYVLGRFSYEWMDTNEGLGFTIPDEVLNPKPKGRPATDFQPGDWFWDSSHDLPLLKMDGGALLIRPEGSILVRSDEMMGNFPWYASCTPVDEDFKPPIHILTGAVQELVDYCAKISPKSNILHGLWQALKKARGE